MIGSRNLGLFPGAKSPTKPSSLEEAEKFDEIDSLAVQKNNNFGMSPDNFIGNDLVSDENYKLDHQSRPYLEKVNIDSQLEFEPILTSAQLVNSDSDSQSIELLEEENPFKFESLAPENQTLSSSDALKSNITLFHGEVLNCINLHERSPDYGIVSFEEILNDCIGSRKVILRRFYYDIKHQLREHFLSKIRSLLAVGVCESDFTICVEYYREAQLATEMNLDVKATLMANAESLAEIIGEDKVNFLFKLSLGAVREYESLQSHLSAEQKRLRVILELKAENYVTDSGYRVKVREDTSAEKPKPDELDQWHLPSDYRQPVSSENDFYMESAPKVKFEAQVVKSYSHEQASNSTAEFVSDTKVSNLRGKRPVYFPETSEELDFMHKKAHELMKFRLSEQSRLPKTNVFRKKVKK